MIGSITIQQEQPLITIAQEVPPVITVMQVLGEPVTIQGGSIVSNSIAFQATATTNNQTVFIIPYTFSTILCLFIMGVGQNILGGDYTINGNQITLSQGVPAGYVIFGVGQI